MRDAKLLPLEKSWHGVEGKVAWGLSSVIFRLKSVLSDAKKVRAGVVLDDVR